MGFFGICAVPQSELLFEKSGETLKMCLMLCTGSQAQQKTR